MIDSKVYIIEIAIGMLHLPGGYMLAEASGNYYMQRTIFKSPPLSVHSGATCLRFYYFLRGDDVNQLTVSNHGNSNPTSISLYPYLTLPQSKYTPISLYSYLTLPLSHSTPISPYPYLTLPLSQSTPISLYPYLTLQFTPI